MPETPGAFQTSVGRKILMAASGACLILFVIVHMAGNLQMFLGQEAMNSYAAMLKGMPVVLWGARFGLLVVVLVHAVEGILLWVRNRYARPIAYVHEDTVKATLSSRMMFVTGVIAAGFVVYHLLHYTIGVTNPEYMQLHDVKGRHDVYTMVVLGFSNPVVSGVYIAVMLMLFMHLKHGFFSMFQTFGINNARWDKFFKRCGLAVALIVVTGFISVPAGVLCGIIKGVGI